MKIALKFYHPWVHLKTIFFCINIFIAFFLIIKVYVFNIEIWGNRETYKEIKIANNNPTVSR